MLRKEVAEEVGKAEKNDTNKQRVSADKYMKYLTNTSA